MTLKVELKPDEKFILGNSVIINGPHRTHLCIEGDEAILREKDILTPVTADTPAKKIYLAVQYMYLDQDAEKHRRIYFDLVTDIFRAAPSTFSYIEHINNRILTASLYKALKEAKALIVYEEELLKNATKSGECLRTDESTISSTT